MSRSDSLDLAVIGAGIYGIQAARIYLTIHPNAKVLIFEGSKTVGGVWSRGTKIQVVMKIIHHWRLTALERMYDAFWTQTTHGIAEFSDLPLQEIPPSDSHHGFFPARYLTDYLEEYVSSRRFANASLKSRILFQRKVSKLCKTVTGWELMVQCTDSAQNQCAEYHASKVIDATGLTSTPNLPLLLGADLFRGNIYHHKQFGQIQEQMEGAVRDQHVIVIGGAKSAADMVYTCAKMGKKVDWIIRRSGSGPAAYASPKGNAFYSNSNESFYTRFSSYFLATLFLDETKSILGRLLYLTSIGRWLMATIWEGINTKTQRLAQYDRGDGITNQFFNLKPDTSIFWQNDSTGICQRPDFFDTIAQCVTVHRQDIARLTEDMVVLADGSQIKAELILCGTGWKTSHPSILNSENDALEQQLGLPGVVATTSDEKKDEEYWAKLESEAEVDILKRFPILKDPPIKPDPQQSSIPLRLYKGLIPPADQTIVFVGQMLLGNNFRVAEVQALFAVAVLDKVLKLPTKEEMERDIAKTVAWNRCRYLKKGQQGTWLYWDAVPYTDHLLECLKLESHRHKGSLKDLFAPCFASDIRNLIAEYQLTTGTKFD